MKKFFLSIALCLTFLLTIAGCKIVPEDLITTDTSLKSITLSKTTDTVKVGESYTLPTTALASYGDSTAKTVAIRWNKAVDTTKAGTIVYTAMYTEEEITVVAESTLIVEPKLTLDLTKATIAIGENFVLPTTGTATYIAGITKTVVLTWDKTVNTAVAGTTIYTASYTENNIKATTTFTLTVNTISVTLKSLSLTSTIGTVMVGGTFALPTTGTATYSDGTTKIVTVSWDKIVNTSVVGTTTYIASYTEAGVKVTTIFTLTVNKILLTLKSLSLTPATATVTVGETFILPKTGTATYSDGTTKTVALTWDKTVNTSVAGTTVYTASYTENGVKVTATFTLTVKTISLTLKSLSLTSTTGTAKVGGTFTLPTTGTATYSDGTTKTVALTWDKTVNTSVAGTTVYTASYTENGVKVTTTFTLTIEAITPAFTIENVTAALNGTVEVIVKASGFTQNATGIDVRLFADSTYLTFVSAEFTGVAAGGLTIAKQESTSNILAATVTSAASGVMLDGNIIKFKFTAIKAGSTVVKMNSVTLLDVNSVKITDTNISDTATITIK